MDKRVMLNMLQSYYGLNKDVDFASLLGISSQVLSNWKTRNTFDAELIYTKCVDINAEWLLSGKGSMYRDKIDSSLNNTVELEQLRKENTMQSKIIELQSEKIATLEEKVQEKSKPVHTLEPHIMSK